MSLKAVLEALAQNAVDRRIEFLRAVRDGCQKFIEAPDTLASVELEVSGVAREVYRALVAIGDEPALPFHFSILIRDLLDHGNTVTGDIAIGAVPGLVNWYFELNMQVFDYFGHWDSLKGALTRWGSLKEDTVVKSVMTCGWLTRFSLSLSASGVSGPIGAHPTRLILAAEVAAAVAASRCPDCHQSFADVAAHRGCNDVCPYDKCPDCHHLFADVAAHRGHIDVCPCHKCPDCSVRIHDVAAHVCKHCCSVCPQVCRSGPDLARHVKAKHPPASPVTMPEWPAWAFTLGTKDLNRKLKDSSYTSGQVTELKADRARRHTAARMRAARQRLKKRKDAA